MLHADRTPRMPLPSHRLLWMVLVVVLMLTSCGTPDDLAHTIPATPASSGAPTIRPVTPPPSTVTPTIFFVDPELDPGPTPTLSPPEMTAVAEYAADLQAERDHAATSYALSPGPVDEPFPVVTPLPLPTVATGLRTFESCGDGEVKELGFWIRNCWTERREAEVLTIYAGEELNIPRGQPTLGGVFVASSTLEGAPAHHSEVYWMPTRVGGVDITQVNGSQLTLQADDGSRWIFDVVTRMWERAPAAGGTSDSRVH